MGRGVQSMDGLAYDSSSLRVTFTSEEMLGWLKLSCSCRSVRKASS